MGSGSSVPPSEIAGAYFAVSENPAAVVGHLDRDKVCLGGIFTAAVDPVAGIRL
jgi:hypothetical protein